MIDYVNAVKACWPAAGHAPSGRRGFTEDLRLVNGEGLIEDVDLLCLGVLL